MPSSHATLGPSSSERWIACPASVRMGEKVPRGPESPYATEGTAAHVLGELKARWQVLGDIDEEQYYASRGEWETEYSISEEILIEMEFHTDAYVELIRERLAVHPNSVALLEQRVATGIPRCWGTSDTVIVSPVHVEIIDLKYGQGVPVEAEGNSQLRLYGVGALDTFGDLLGEVETVYTTVFQPRLNHTLTASIPAADLRAWRDSLLPVAEEALSEDAHFGPSEDACRWCPAAGRCRAQLEFATKVDFGQDIEILDGDDYAEILAQIPAIKRFLTDIEAASLNRVYSEGESIPGYKVVLSGGKRVVADSDGALEALALAGYDPDQVSEKKISGIGVLEKLLGKVDFQTILGDYVNKTPGRPSLVPEGDKRPSVTPNSEAQSDFAEEE